jgi:hypothetical protein
VFLRTRWIHQAPPVHVGDVGGGVPGPVTQVASADHVVLLKAQRVPLEGFAGAISPRTVPSGRAELVKTVQE